MGGGEEGGQFTPGAIFSVTVQFVQNMAAQMSESRIRLKLRNKYPTNRRQLERILETQRVAELTEHCQSLGVIGYSGKRKERLVELLVQKWEQFAG